MSFHKKKSENADYREPNIQKIRAGLSSLAVAAVLVFATTGQYAFADNLQADALDSSTLSVSIEEGNDTDVEYWLVANGADGCNVDATHAATVTLNLPSGVSASQNPFTLNQCKVGTSNNGVTITFTGDSAGGPYDITVTSITGGKAGNNGYNTNPANALDITVTEPPAPSDTTAPTTTATLDPSSPDGDNNWYVSDVTVTLSAEDNSGGSGVDSTTYEIDGGSTQTYSAPFTVSDNGEHTVTFRSEDNDGNVESDQSVTFKIDQTKPTIDGTATPAANSDGWNNEDVSITFECDDATSGIASCDGDTTLTDETDTTGVTVAGTATDNAGNSDTDDAGPIKIDKTDPTNVHFTDGALENNGVYYYGLVPAAPTDCTAEDALSGLDHCSVDSSNGGTSIGSHSYGATAVDNADNEASITLSYTVNHWTLNGFYQPVDPGTTVNTVKAGSTVPFKFEVLAGSTEFTSTSFNNSPVGTFSAKKVSCTTGSSEDTIEVTSTGGTSFRYDTTSGQFVYNWQTPKNTGSCYDTTFTAQDGSTLTAHFKLK